MKNPYKTFDRYVLRTPVLSFSGFDTLSRKRTIEDTNLKDFCDTPLFREALFLASPDLYTAFEKWLIAQSPTRDKDLKMRHTVLKYLSRMSTRCTPFGLFAGTAVGHFSEENSIELDTQTQRRHTRLDMNYLVALALNLSKREDIKSQLKFYPNTSLYRLGGDLRYIEYSYVHAMRQHHIMAVEETEYLLAIIQLAELGTSYIDLIHALINEEITYEESKGFIDELIASQVLISDLEPSVSGDEFTDQILDVLSHIPAARTIHNILKDVQQKLIAIDQVIGNDPAVYDEIATLLETLNVDFDRKYLFQTDLVHQPRTNTLGKISSHQVQRAMRFLNKITEAPKETTFSKFADAFYKRYEEEEVPLSKAMDADLGIGFDQNSGHGDISAIVDDVSLPYSTNSDDIRTDKTTPIDRIILEKLRVCKERKEVVLELKERDFKDQIENWEDLPDTMYAMVELIQIEGQEKIVLGSLGGSSAANLLGRFCHGDDELHALVQEIVAAESKMAKETILAEIVHLPESRMGNILMRPSLRNYEIPFLAQSTLAKEQQIQVEDLVLQMSSRKKMILKSKQHNKQVVPRLTNAHNYSGRALPTYQCLASLQHPEGRKGLGFGWPQSAEQETFLPRVIFEDCILSPKTWNLKSADLEDLKKAQEATSLKTNSEDIFAKAIEEFNLRFDLPEFVLLKEGDNELLVRLTNHCSVSMFLDAIGKKKRFQLVEFLHSEKGAVQGANGHYTNQVIMTFYNSDKLNDSILHD